MKQHFYVLAFLLAGLISLESNAESDFSKVANILQTSCATAYCHSGSVAPDMSGTEDELYEMLLQASPINETAIDRGYKYISPG